MSAAPVPFDPFSMLASKPFQLSQNPRSSAYAGPLTQATGEFVVYGGGSGGAVASAGGPIARTAAAVAPWAALGVVALVGGAWLLKRFR